MPALTSIALGLGALGAVGGAISGASDEVTTSGRNVAPPSQRELDLQNQSMSNYLQQLAMANQQENAIGQGQGLQDTSRGTLQDVIGGEAFNINPEQQNQINAIRQASVDAGTGNVQDFVNKNLSDVSNSAGVRGLRGQAVSELQGRAIGEGARQIANLQGQANVTAAQQSLDVPFRQAQLQGGLANSNSNFMENLRNQAMQNRQQLQNPVLMQTLQNERQGNASTTTTNPGSFGKAVGGALGGFGSVANGTLGFANGVRNLNSGGSSNGVDYGTAPIPQMSDYGFWKGGFVPGREHVEGSHPENDTIRARLSAGELVIPKEFAQDPKLSKAYVDFMHKKNSDAKKGLS